MIQVSVFNERKEIPLHNIPVNENGSFTDYENPETEIVIVKSLEDCGEVYVSTSGYSVEFGEFREINSSNLRFEKKFTDTYSRPLTTKFGKTTLILKFKK